MPVYARIDRRRLLDLLSESEVSSRVAIEDRVDSTEALIRLIPRAGLRPDDLLILWKGNASVIDDTRSFVIVVPDDEHADFLAWASTYIGTYTPFTAFFRVIKISDLERFEVLDTPKCWIEREILSKMSGVAIAEAAVQTDFKSAKPSNITLQSIQLTFSFAALRGLNAGLHPAQLFDLSEAWAKARYTSSSRGLLLDPDRAMSFWLIATSSLLEGEGNSGRDSTWMTGLAGLIRAAPRGDADLDLVDWSSSPEVESVLSTFRESSSLPRERQLRVLDELVARLRKSDLPLPLIEAVLGYLVARLGNGSFDYLGLVGEYREDLQCAALWFAFFSVWQRGFDGLSAGNSLGRHAANKAAIVEDLFSSPAADLALQEFLMLADRKTGSTLNNTIGSLVEVELLPRLSCQFPNPFKRDEDIGRPLALVDTQRLYRILREALYVLEQPNRNVPTRPQSELNDLFRDGAASTTSKASKSSKPKKR